MKIYIALFAMVPLFYSCEKFEPKEPEEEELLDGPIEGLTHAENARFVAGDVAFNDEVFTVSKGLGPNSTQIVVSAVMQGMEKELHLAH